MRKNRKLIALVCLLLTFVMLASACNGEGIESGTTGSMPKQTEASTSGSNQNGSNNSNGSNNDNEGNGSTQTKPCDEHDYKEVSRRDAQALKEGEIKYSCTGCGASYLEEIPATNSIKILALGNSFTDDSTQHLWNICKDAGIETVIVGNLYKGNCTLDTHWTNLSQHKAAYTYRKNVSGTKVNTDNYKALDAIKDEDWDYIVLHQTSGSAGFEDTFKNLTNIINYINIKVLDFYLIFRIRIPCNVH